MPDARLQVIDRPREILHQSERFPWYRGRVQKSGVIVVLVFFLLLSVVCVPQTHA